MAGSLGLRASNKSATRGRPPVISRVFELSCGIRASTSPGLDSIPSVASMVVKLGKRISCKPNSSLSRMSLGSFALALDKSFTTIRVRPVKSSCCISVLLSSTSEKLIFAARSVTIGCECGSQLATTSPEVTFAPSSTVKIAP